MSRFLSFTDETTDIFLERAVHDLRAAARGISMATELGIGTVPENLGRLNCILDGITSYMRAAAHDGYGRQRYSTDHALTAAIQALDPLIQESAATVSRANLPDVCGDPEWIRELFRILILNSIRYRGTAAPAISFSAAADGEFWLFSVADNGTGVEAKYRERIFRPFERLHGPSVPGSGLGLSIAEEIVHAHGGKIWVAEPTGPGTTIQFRLLQWQPAL
jgi:signal transduction histidine kinase